jgi:hypothetical protein
MPTVVQDKPRSLTAWWQMLLVLLPAVAAYAVLWRCYTAVPIIDDYPELFVFAIGFTKAQGLVAKLGLLFTAQVGPYKLLLDHGLVALQLLLTGHMDLPVMIVLGNLMPIGIFALLWRHAEKNNTPARSRLLLLLPVSLLVFSMNYAETLDWAMIGLQHPAVIFFSMAALHFLVQHSGKSFVLACGLAMLASATSANGLLLWPVGLLYLLLHDRRPARLLGWCAAIAVTVFAYFFRFQPEGLSVQGTVAGKLMFFTMFCGGAMENMHHKPLPYLSLAIGAGVLLVIADAVRTRFDRRNPFVFFTAVWLLCTAIVVANGRAAMGLELSLSSRYKIFCDVLLACCYLYLLDRMAGLKLQRWLVAASIAGALVVCVGGDVAGAKLLALRRSRAEAAMNNYAAAPQSASPMFVVEDELNPAEVMEEERARQELNEAIRLGIYKPTTPWKR